MMKNTRHETVMQLKNGDDLCAFFSVTE